jgi:hypothetical protein
MEEPDMANERKPNTPYEPEYLHQPTEPNLAQSETRSPADFERDLRSDQEPRAASNTRIVLLMLGIAVVLGVVFYGMNNSTVNQQASTAPVPVNSQPATTGQAPANPSNAPASK